MCVWGWGGGGFLDGSTFQDNRTIILICRTMTVLDQQIQIDTLLSSGISPSTLEYNHIVCVLNHVSIREYVNVHY